MDFIAIFSLAILIFSIILHEVAHGYAANALGDPTARMSGRLTLNPAPHIDPLGSLIIPALLVFTSSPILFGWAKPVPYNPYNLRNQRWAEAAVAAAGSVTNIVIAIIFGLIVRFGAGLPAETIHFASLVSLTNLFLGLFNLFPFPPLDGFTVIRALLPWRLASHLHNFEHKVRNAGIVSLILFLLIFSTVLSGPFFSLIVRVFSLITG